MKKFLLSLFALCVANLALAQINFQDITPDATVTTQDEMGYPIYVYGVGEWNAEFYIQNYMYPDFPSSSYVACFVDGAGVVVDGSDNVVAMTQGQTIGSSCNFQTSDGNPAFPVIYDADIYTTWLNQTAYVGFKVKNAGATHYGWIKMSVNSNNTFTVYEYAWQTTPNTAIAAGDKGGVGIESAVVANNMSLYPNPATSNLTINFTEQVEMIKIYSVEGREMMQFVPSSLTETINISSLNSGVYFVVSQKGNEKSVQKLIVK